MDLDTTALLGFLGVIAGGVLAFAREQVRWYQEHIPRMEAILEKQQGTLEQMHADEIARDASLRATLEERLPKGDAPTRGASGD